MFVQMRTPYRDNQTGQVVRNGQIIALRYLRTWFFIDLMSVIPFDYLGFLNNSSGSSGSGSNNLGQLRNSTLDSIGVLEIYFAALYWSSATISLVGPTNEILAPTNTREYGFAFFANFLAYMNAVYGIAVLSDVLAMSTKVQRSHDIVVDQYLEMIDRLKLDFRLKLKVYEYLSEHYALEATQGYSGMLKDLPTQLHGFITMEIFIDFIAQVPFLEIFIEREPYLMQELCRTIEIKSFAANSHIFTEGYEGIYFIERGVCAIEGVVFTTGQVFGRSVLREKVKSNECRALTTVTIHLLSRKNLMEILAKYPKIRYYAKRWTSWAVLRKYLKAYAKLYYMAARRGARLIPPLESRRPLLREGELDEIDLAVIDHMAENGF
ncbi:hypothetical protein HK405_008258 [Cladochytrium tenue]|nr:hypothetical protein HK405_008258 [Cladochytrium tenue]